jgi:hypothetical protein
MADAALKRLLEEEHGGMMARFADMLLRGNVVRS